MLTPGAAACGSATCGAPPVNSVAIAMSMFPAQWMQLKSDGKCTEKPPERALNLDLVDGNQVDSVCCLSIPIADLVRARGKALHKPGVVGVVDFVPTRIGSPAEIAFNFFYYQPAQPPDIVAAGGIVVATVSTATLSRKVVGGAQGTLFLPPGMRVYAASVDFQYQGALIAASHGSVFCKPQQAGLEEINAIPVMANQSSDPHIRAHALQVNWDDDEIDDASRQKGANQDDEGFIQPEFFDAILEENQATGKVTKFLVRERVFTQYGMGIFAAVLWNEEDLLEFLRNQSKLADEDTNQAVTHIEDRENRRDREMILIVVFAVAAIIAVALVVVYRITRSLNKLQQQMRDVAEMDLDCFDNKASLSRLAEVRCMQISFRNMVNALREYKSFLPEYVLHNPEASDPSEQVEAGKPSPVRNMSLAAAPSSPVESRNSQEVRMRLLTAVGELRVKRASLLSARLDLERFFTGDFGGSVLQAFAANTLDSSRQVGGSVLHIAAWHIVVSWNCIRGHPGHAQAACRCALLTANRLEEGYDDLPFWTLSCATGQLGCGVIGTEDTRAPTVIGWPVASVRYQAELGRQLRLRCVVDQAALEGARSVVVARPVDVLHVPLYPDLEGTEAAKAVHTLRIYELQLSRDSDAPAALWGDEFRSGFSELLAGRYASAAQILECTLRTSAGGTLGTDETARRLLRLARHFVKKPLPGPYARSVGFLFTDFEAAAEPIEQGLVMDVPPAGVPALRSPHYQTNGSMETPLSTAKRGRLQTPADGWQDRQRKSVAESVAGTDGQQLRSHLRTQRSMAVSPMLSDTSRSTVDLPVRFRDLKGDEWCRSETLLGKGAFGSVWLGMSMEGGIVAVKSQRIDAGPAGGPSAANTPGGVPGTGSFTTWGSGAVSAPPTELLPALRPEQVGLASATLAQPPLPGMAVQPPGLPQDPPSLPPPERSPERSRTSCPTEPVAGERRPSQRDGAAPPDSAADRGRRKGSAAWQISSAEVNMDAGASHLSMTEHLASLVGEIELLSSLRHENVVSFLGCAVEGTYVLVIMEYLPGGSLADLLSKFGKEMPGPSVRRYAADIVRGLAFLHSKDVIHLDLKPGNVLVTLDGQAKLADFGMSVSIKDLIGRTHGIRGTPVYMAPEQARGQSETASDIWAFGIMMCQLLSGKLPWPACRAPGFDALSFLYRLGSDESMLPAIPTELDPTAERMIRRCLQRGPAGRPTALQLLNDPYLL